MTHINVTHVGSLPRTQKVVDFIFAREREEPYEDTAFDAAMTEAVDETVRKQADAGVDIVVWSMRGAVDASRLEPLAAALS